MQKFNYFFGRQTFLKPHLRSCLHPVLWTKGGERKEEQNESNIILFFLIVQLPNHIELLLAALMHINEPDSLYGIIQSHKVCQ